MADKILSISIAAYNVAETLKECLEPLLHSKCLEKLDVMIVNDGSTDDTLQIAEAYARAYPGAVRLLNKENGGWGSTLNAGMKEAQGKYFKQLDGDDYFSAENLDDFVQFLEGCNADAVYSPFIKFEHETGAVLKLEGEQPGHPPGEVVPLSELKDLAPAMHAWCVKTLVLQDNPIQITEHCFYTDVEFVLKTCNFCETVTFYPLPVYCYRLSRGGQSMSVEGIRKHYRDHLKMVTTLLRYEKESLTSPQKHDLFYPRLLGCCHMQYLIFFALDRTHGQKQELKAFDRLLKTEYPQYYAAIASNPIRILRATHFWGYWIIGYLKSRKDKRLKQYVFQNEV